MPQPLRSRARAGLWGAAALLAALGAWHAVIWPLPPLQRLELAVDDLRLRAFLSDTPYPDITIVDIDEASLNAVGRWPWGRDRLAALTNELFERQRIAVLGFDFVFAEPDGGAWAALQPLAAREPELAARLPGWRAALDHDHDFASALQNRPVVLGYYLTADRGGGRNGQLPAPLFATTGQTALRLPGWSGYGANVPALAAAAPQAGFFNALPDDDGVVRTVPAVAQFGEQVYASLALAMLRAATGAPAVQPVTTPAGGRDHRAELAALVLSPATGPARRLGLDERGALRVPYRGSGGPMGRSFRYVSAQQVLSGRLAPGELAGQLVLVGSSAPGLADLRATPVHSAMPGVEVHAHLLAGLLDGHLPQRPAWAPGFEAALIGLSLALAALAGSRLSAPRALLATSVLGALLVLGNLAAYSLGALVLPVVSALVLSGLLFAGMAGASYLYEWKSRRSLMQLFSSYVPPDRARQLARDPSLQHVAAANCELTLLFCDLRGFSGIAETLPPLALRDLLNEYLSQATEIVHRHGGTLDKFIGDAVMAFWGAPQPQVDHAARAVRAAMELTASMAPLNVRLLARGLPAVRFGIGLATGVVCVGDLGSKLRRSYTAVGDAVNLAARLEALTREVEVDLLVSDSTCAACLATPAERALGAEIIWAEVEQCLVRGRRQPVTVFTPLTAVVDHVPMLVEQVRIWRLALSAAQQHHVSDAHNHLARLSALLALNPTSAHSLAPGHNTAGWTLQMLSERLSRQLRSGQPVAPCSAPLSRPVSL